MATIRLKRVLDYPLKTTTGTDHALWVECEYITPPSWARRTLDLYLSAEDVTALLLELRDSAREARR